MNHKKSFKKIWILVNFYSKICGLTLVEEPNWYWKIYNRVASFNTMVFYCETIYDIIENRHDGAKMLTFICFFCLLNLGMSFKMVFNHYMEDIIHCIKWCESRHQFEDERILYHSRHLFDEALEVSVQLLRRRVNITLGLTTALFIAGAIAETIHTGEYSTMMGVYSPLYEIDDPFKFVLNNIHHLWAILFPLTGGVLFGGITTLIFQYTYGQFELTEELIKEFTAITKLDPKRFDEKRLSEIVDFYNDANQ